MVSRRDFISYSMATAALAATSPIFSSYAKPTRGPWSLPVHFGMGGVALGNAFKTTSDEEARGALEAAWNTGVRYFDTSPFYGHGLSEQRFGSFLDDKNRLDYILSTKVGRIFKPNPSPRKGLWIEPSHFDYEYDYTAGGARRSIEDSLQRMGVESIDIVFIHDLSPDNKDFKGKWKDYFKIAQKGSMKELTKMREEGLIKAWGLGVNEIDPLLMAMDVSKPDICLSATQYSLIKHEDAIKRLFPACEKNNVKLVIGAPLNAGFLAGVERYDYSGTFPDGVVEKRKQMMGIAEKHDVDLRTAALQFSAAPKAVAAVIPGARNAKQAMENAKSMSVKIPAEFWEDLKREKLIAEAAEVH